MPVFPWTFLIPFAEIHGIHGVDAALLITLMGVGGLASRLAVGRITKRLGSVSTYRPTGLFGSYLIWVFAPPTIVVLIAFALAAGASYGGTVATCPVMVAEAYGAKSMSTVLGVLLTANGIGGLVCLVGAGALIDATGSFTAAIVVAAVLAAGSVCATLPIQGRRSSGRPAAETADSSAS